MIDVTVRCPIWAYVAQHCKCSLRSSARASKFTILCSFVSLLQALVASVDRTNGLFSNL